MFELLLKFEIVTSCMFPTFAVLWRGRQVASKNRLPYLQPTFFYQQSLIRN